MKQKNIFLDHLILILILSLILISVAGCNQKTAETSASVAEDISVTDIEEDDTPVYLNCKSDDRSNHVLLRSRENGSCQTLTGDVLVTVIFVTDPESKWSEQDMEAVKTACENGSNNLMQTAKTYGADLNLQLNYANSTLDFILDREDASAEDILKEANLPDLPEAVTISESLETAYSVKEAPLVFVLNRLARSCAYNDRELEFALWYAPASGDFSQDASTFQHEFLHLFGAVDFYYPENITELASEYMPDSIMNNGEHIDEFTSYLVGWTNEFTEATSYFYQETLLTTAEEIATAHAENTFTGHKTIPFWGGTYTGELVNGLPEGQGKLTWDGGASYEGEWKGGIMHGYGTFTNSMEGIDSSWNVEVSYTGEFRYGLRHGKGTITFSDGLTATGIWEDDIPIQWIQ